jgi:hypothetical protein
MQKRLALLAETYAIDGCAYAFLSNHYHLVVRLCPERVDNWSDREVVERWMRLFSGSVVARRFLDGAPMSASDIGKLCGDVAKWRERLGNLSWFMRCFNEHIARRANSEDECTGHFWESRFKSQALLDTIGLITAMAYVDLNPIRAGLADNIPTSDFTSGQDRWNEVNPGPHFGTGIVRPRLLPFIDTEHLHGADHIPFNLEDYLELLDTTSRAVIVGRRGFISSASSKLLDDLHVDGNVWLETVTTLQQHFSRAIGAPERLQGYARRCGQRWLTGVSHARKLVPMTVY